MIRILVLGLAGSLVIPPSLPAQVPDGPVPILREHAAGGELPFLAAGASFLGSAVIDVLAAPGSARWYNERDRDDTRWKSPRTAFSLSLVSTAIPVVLGAATIAQEDVISAGLIYGGLLVGPSVGHWYAGRSRRALVGIGLRAGLTIVAGALAQCCT